VALIVEVFAPDTGGLLDNCGALPLLVAAACGLAIGTVSVGR
jgi:hypothetical protein